MNAKEFRFPVSIDWLGGKRVRAHAGDKHTIDIATPPEFGSGIERVWSPEDFLVAAAASCFAVTLVAIADRRGLILHDLDVDAVGLVGGSSGALGFERVRLDVCLETDSDDADAMRAAAERAEKHCLISAALSVPVEVALEIRTRDFAELDWEPRARPLELVH